MWSEELAERRRWRVVWCPLLVSLQPAAAQNWLPAGKGVPSRQLHWAKDTSWVREEDERLHFCVKSFPTLFCPNKVGTASLGTKGLLFSWVWKRSCPSRYPCSSSSFFSAGQMVVGAMGCISSVPPCTAAPFIPSQPCWENTYGPQTCCVHGCHIGTEDSDKCRVLSGEEG